MIKMVKRSLNRLKVTFQRKGVDKTIYLCVVALAILGIVMIGSASVGQIASQKTSFAIVNMVKQGAFVVTGLGFMIFFARCFKRSWIGPYSTWILYWGGLIAMLVCLLFESTKGSYAWIKLPGFTIQPAEFMKVILILFLSFHLGEIEQECTIPKNISQKKKEELQMRKCWYSLIRPLLATIVVFVVGAFFQKDLGSAVIIAFICMMMFFMTPRPYYIKYKKIVLIVILAFISFGGIIFSSFLQGYQMSRITTWLDPLADPLNAGHQLVNSLISFATGGMLGKGFYGSTQKFGYIPESHNDFIMAIIYEELGMVGFLAVILLYSIIIFKLFGYGMKIKDAKGKLILFGIATYFFIQLIVNVGGVSGLIPMTGVPLLLVSLGGSSTWAALIAIGIAQSIISKYNRERLKEQI